jgi:hypothetical protein
MKALFFALLLVASQARADESSALARLLWESASRPEQRAPLLRPILSLVFLSEHNRLLPRDADSILLKTLAAQYLAVPADTRGSDLLPPSDHRFFDGTSLSGGNFAALDPLVGRNGLPVAFDRQLPILLVPLKEAEVPILEKVRTTFQSRPESESIRTRTNRLLQADVGTTLAEDGCILRPYAGKLDDLYFHLFQEGDAASQTNFHALIETLPERTYHPTAGIGAPASIPPIWFSLSDILSGGGLAAFQKYTAEHPESKLRNPFTGIALHLLPMLDPTPRASGSSISVTHEIMRRALQSSKRFSAPEVKPLFRDPGRFLGDATPRYFPVKNGPTLTREQVETELALPQSLEDPAANEAFRGPVYWENPENNPLLPSAPNRLVPASPSGKTLPPAGPSKKSVPSSLPPTEAIRPSIPRPTAPSKPQPAMPDLERTPAKALEAPPAAASPPKTAVQNRSTETPPASQVPAVRALPVEPLPVDQSRTATPRETRKRELDPSEDPSLPTYRPKPRFSVAVLLPTVAQAETYIQGIATNDAKLQAGLREENHAVCKARWLLEALGSLETVAPELAQSHQSRVLLEVGALRSRILHLRAERNNLLQKRDALRESVQNPLRGERLKSLRSQLGSSL